MEQAFFRFYAELNDFLPPCKRQVAFAHPFEGRASIKDMVEALGIPHPEIDLLLVNGGSVDFSYIEVIRHFDLSRAITPFQRCPHCNGLTKPTSKERISERLPPKVRQYYDEFRVCENCSQIYWKGTHYDHMQRFIRLLKRKAEPS